MLGLSDSRTSPAPPIHAGDQVLINAEHIDTSQKSKKLAFRFIGPYTVTAQLGPVNFRVHIPNSSRHDVFHVDRLRPYVDPESFPHRPTLDRPPPELVDSNAYLVSKILDSARKRRKLFYLVEWEGYGPEDREWVRASEFHPDDTLVEHFRAENPTKETHTTRRQA
ncbi:uncharacterized protein MKK02DRAFT_24341 [Dioszegia hungarica]|uniref:Chromo domain-containing protein n=1 Tax=Dioszegia hungarica TaxID=4972 RepID=A0AA38HB82_9TREE|nr:uncharacterized protein MKK02DRAFT_24341 [Dioszegia hungarica]KAI9637203.1 hypothetical protein MKK02DRAFT_24341 [Dioszegia hungarica]